MHLRMVNHIKGIQTSQLASANHGFGKIDTEHLEMGIEAAMTSLAQGTRMPELMKIISRVTPAIAVGALRPLALQVDVDIEIETVRITNHLHTTVEAGVGVLEGIDHLIMEDLQAEK